MQSLELQDNILQQLSKYQAERCSTEMQIDIMDMRSEGFGATVVGYLATQGEQSELAMREQSLREALLSTLYNPTSSSADGIDATPFRIPENRKGLLHETLLSRLYYGGMERRAATVADAHEDTFRWILDDTDKSDRPWHSFSDWLASDSQLYWITGKAGSGKSTLMKFITQPQQTASTSNDLVDWSIEPRCAKHLQQWSQDKPLTIASFYFWAAGSDMQTSKSGLYRTLLYQILKKHPDMISHTFPDRWEALCLFNEDPKPFTDEEYRTCLTGLIQLLHTNAKIALFIDGLDEFDGDHGELIELLKQLIDTSSIKVCLASRPWVVFEEALRHQPSLMLQDLTFQDIKLYATARFNSDANFSQLQTREPEFAESLIERIVRKAAGVFLWVNLVVTSLLDGMKFGDRVSDLQRRLDALPPELEDLYDRILLNLDPFYFEHAAQLFSLMAACHEPPSAVLFSLADEDRPNYLLEIPFKVVWSYSDYESRVETVQRRLNSRCRGLIEVSHEMPVNVDTAGWRSQTTVQYLHKTVKDYVEKPDIHEKLRRGLKSPFDPHLRFCVAYMAKFKVDVHSSGVSLPINLARLSSSIVYCMRHASQVSAINVPQMVRALDHLEKAVYASGLPSLFSPSEPFSKIMPVINTGYTYLGVFDFEVHGNTFLSLAVKCGVVEYVRARISTGCLVPDGQSGFEVGYEAASSKLSRQKRFPVDLDTKWTKLLRKPMIRLKFWGAQVSVRLKDLASKEGWQLLLDATPSYTTNVLMVSTLLEKGADPNFEILDANGRALTVWITTLATVVFQLVEGGVKDGKIWLEVAQLMVNHGARIDRSTISAALSLVRGLYYIHGMSEYEVGHRLEKEFRRSKSCQGQLGLDFLDSLLLI
jgi:hypothetical protein